MRGRGSWVSDRRIVYRTHKYWHPHQAIGFTAHLAGVRAAKDTYGVRDVTRSFTVGASNVTVANAKTHYMTVNHDGTVKKFKISAGKGDRPDTITTNGIHLTREKDRVTTMTATCQGQPGCDNYKEEVHLAVRITWGGEYVHQSVGEYRPRQAERQPRVRPHHARRCPLLLRHRPGDIVDVTGTTRRFADEPYAEDWKFWTRSWRQWLAGSALRDAGFT